MKKLTITFNVFVGIVVFAGICFAVTPQDKGNDSSSIEETLVREKLIIEEEPAMAVIPGSTFEVEKLKRIPRFRRDVSNKYEQKAKIPE